MVHHIMKRFKLLELSGIDYFSLFQSYNSSIQTQQNQLLQRQQADFNP